MMQHQQNVGTRKVRQASAVPTRKVKVGVVGGAFSAIVVWVLNDFNLLSGGQDIPPQIALAITTVFTFIISYLVPPSSQDQVVVENEVNHDESYTDTSTVLR